ncbi:hypothetical protein Vretimale_2760 [Volvox reticuliferus]|uniref:Uncharacterized protein n=1 Tax=Volvox reticuliferus TaxID=1737510 RepID=A0A8J4DDN6_9CHLO|nr:hypothetical protein Vretifemale_1927 [Volvox reticuliferus]GIL97057.1 hypothetical protein Vretimale_2760 [Volvox reticuliferus]
MHLDLQARTARKTKAAPPAATGYRPHASAAAGAAPAQGANLSVARAAKMAAAPSLVHTSNRVGPQIERMESDFSGGTDPQPCRIRELRGSRSSNNSSPSGNSAVSDGSTDTKSDRDSGRGFGMRSLGRDRLRRGFQHHVARTTAPQRPLPRIEPLVDLPTSPDITSPFPPWAVSGADAIADAVVTSRQPFVTMPPSSSEPSRRRSLDSIWATSRRSTSSGDDGGSANGDVAAAAALLVSVPGTPEDESSLGRRWRGAHVTMNRSPTPHAWSSQPRITSLSTSPEGLFGALLAPVSLSSSSIESIRVPPGGRIAASLAGGGSGRGGHDDTSAARVAYFSYINTPEQALSSRGDGEGNRIVRGPVVASGTSRRAWDEGHTRTAMQAEQYARTFDRGHILAPRTRQDASKSDASDTTHFSSTTATRTATLTGAPVHGGGGDIVNYGSEEFSWTFDRGDERAEDNIADGSLRPGPGSPTNGTGEMGGGGRNGGALPCTAMERGDVRVRTRYEDNDSSESEGRRGRGRGGVLERRSRKGRRGKGGHPAGDVAARTQGIGDRKGAIVHLSEAAGVLMFRTHLNGCNTSESISFSGGGSDSDGSDSNSSSSSGMGSESSSGSGKLSEEGKREEEEGEDDSESSGSWNEYGLPELRAQPPSKYNRFHKHREYFERNHGAGTIIRPSQLPLPAPRHQRRRSVQRSEVSNTDREAIGENRRCRQRERPRRKRGNQERIQVVEEGIQVDGTDCTAHGGIRGSMPAATAWDRTVLSGIREWPYRLYISMELVRGPTLTLWLQQRTERLLNGSSSLGYRAPDHPPDPPTVERSIFRQIVTGLCHVHASGIIHRDLKPANIFLVPFEKASVAAGAGSWDGVGARSTMGSGTTVLPASARADVDFYLVKIGDFGLAVDHELPQDLVDNPREAFSLSTSTSTSSAAPLDGPLGSAATIATAAVGHGAQLHRPLSVPLLSDAPLASGGSGEGILPTAEGSGLDMPRWNSSSTSAHTSGVGTASYSAPEQLRDHLSGVSFYGPAVDIYPLGLILMELFCLHGTGCAPRYGKGYIPDNCMPGRK